ncbi:MAG: beta-galactosidase trimerization domain-containing protein, partial [Planctomycetota bacterium]
LHTSEIESWLRDFCEAGGQIFLYPGAGERNLHGAQGEAPPPGAYAALAGVELEDYVPLDLHMGQAFDHQAGTASASRSDEPTQIGVELGGETIAFDIRHSEILNPTTARTIATYAEGIASGRPAIACNTVGDGCLTYLGAIPSDTDDAIRLWQLLLPDLMGENRLVQHWRCTSSAGPLSFYFNPHGCDQPLGAALRDELTNTEMSTLPAYGVALVKGE